MPTKIEWVKNQDGSQGESWNPIRARRKSDGKVGWFCTKVSAGCAHCYAERINKRLGTFLPYTETSLSEIEVFLDQKTLEKPLRWRKPRMVFVCSMSDLFHEDVPEDFIVSVFATMVALTEHTFQVLTKRPERMCDFVTRRVPGIEQWSNIWLGVTAENQAAADERIPLLLQCPAAVRFVSVEPLLELIMIPEIWLGIYREAETVRMWFDGGHRCLERVGRGIIHHDGSSLNWLIVGGESGPGVRPMHPDWARSLVQQGQAAGVPVFVKQLGSHWARYAGADAEDWRKTVKQRGDVKGHDMQYWPEDLRVREMPEVNK